jgi:hypothetical protein
LTCIPNPLTPPNLSRRKTLHWRSQAPQQRISPITPKRIVMVIRKPSVRYSGVRAKHFQAALAAKRGA